MFGNDFVARGYGAAVARLTPDQTVGRSNRSGLNYCCYSGHPCEVVIQMEKMLLQIRDSIVVSISACHADDPGSIPGRGDICHARCVERLCVLSQFFLNVEELCALCYELLQWLCGPMDKATVYGTGDCRFESYQGQLLPIFE